MYPLLGLSNTKRYTSPTLSLAPCLAAAALAMPLLYATPTTIGRRKQPVARPPQPSTTIYVVNHQRTNAYHSNNKFLWQKIIWN